MNRPIRVLAVGCLVLFLAVLGRATYLQYYEADSLGTVSAHENNIRVIDAQFARQRGAIVVGGKSIAISRKVDDKYKFQRTYPQGDEYAHITGFFTRDWGLGGIESSENALLSGESDTLFLNRVVDLMSNREPKGGSVVLTLNAKAQKAAYDGLRGKIGAVVALEPSTGRVLAMASSPTYDPNRLATHDFKKVGPYKTRLFKQKPSPLNNIGIETVVPPGSTFKVVTTSAALSSGKYTPDSLVPGASSMKLPLSSSILHNENGFACGAGRVTLTVALEKSCNVAFGTVGGKLGVDRLSAQAKKFGFGQDYFDDLDVLSKTDPEPIEDQPAVSPSVARQVTQMMVDVVDNGTGTPARIPGVQVAGKTGTAQSAADRPPYAWFLSFAPADDPKVAVAVLIQDAGVARDAISGGGLAAPIAKAVMEAVINK
jgi:peptidoglycan glycosyltransferase